MFQPLRKYADFNGRARRSEYWLFALFQILLAIVLYGVILAIGLSNGREQLDENSPMAIVAGLVVILAGIAWLALVIPGLAVMVRRLHDSNHSGWLVLIGFVPFGGLVLFVFSLLDGTPGPNQYGPDPKGRGQVSVSETFS